MLQISKILLRGHGVKDAEVVFESGANVLAGESDTGKSHIITYVDYVLGAKDLATEDAGSEYNIFLVEFKNLAGERLTLARKRGENSLQVHRKGIDNIAEAGEFIQAYRTGKSTKPDVSSILLPFAGMKEARLRKNVDGHTQRLTIRTLSLLFLIDEVSVINIYSPVTGKKDFDFTPRKRAFSYLLSNTDDSAVQATESDEIAKAGLRAKLDLIALLIEPLEKKKLRGLGEADELFDDEALDRAIKTLEAELEHVSELRNIYHQDSLENANRAIKVESQILGSEQLLSRYDLLKQRYKSDLNRLDFITEGAFYLNELQDVACPICDQLITPEHALTHQEGFGLIRDSAVAEATKIRTLGESLDNAITDLSSHRTKFLQEKQQLEREQNSIDLKYKLSMSLGIEDELQRLTKLISERTEREAFQNDMERLDNFLALRQEISDQLGRSAAPKREWSALPTENLRKLCVHIENVLNDWNWKGNRIVEFDEKKFDILVGGKPRHSHGKGVRAILYSAFAIGLLKYCAAEGYPHPGFVIIDSPLTSYMKKKSQSITGQLGEIESDVEMAFWKSLVDIPKDIQIIIIENKEPPSDVAKKIHYEWFAGEHAVGGQRVGLIPTI